MRYCVGEINYSGRLLTREDEATLLAVLDDLLAPEIVMAGEREGGAGFLPRDLARGHYGVPRLNMGEGYYSFVRTMPLFDDERIFGFEGNAERTRLGCAAFDLFNSLHSLEYGDESTEENPLDVTVRDRSDLLVQKKAKELL